MTTLPPVTQPAGQPGSGAADAETGSGRRVLVVDDNRDAAESMGMLLEMSGCKVRIAFDGPEALRIAEEYVPEVVLLDIGMPGMDGYEVARRLRASPKTRSARLIALTGWGQAEDKQRTAAAGFDEHFTKPVEPDLLGKLLC